MKDEIVLQTHGLKKHFSSVWAVDGIDLEVRRGEVYGFLGPNGDGKTTTIGVALGLLHATAGEVSILGEAVSPGKTHALKRVGSLVGRPALIPYLSAYQNLELLSRLAPGTSTENINETLEKVGLVEVANRKAGRFSTGMKQRLGLAMALLHHPELLLLDEPTIGMDPGGMHEIRTLLRNLANQGVTVFLSSHLLFEVEQICDRVAVINKGRIVASGPVSALLGDQQIVRIRVSSPAEAASVLEDAQGVTGIDINGFYLSIHGIAAEKVLELLAQNGIYPGEVSSRSSDLESVFLQLTQENED